MPVVFDGSVGGFASGASLDASATASATNDAITLTLNSEFRAQINLTGAAQADLTEYSKFKFNWEIEGGVTGWFGGNYNITLNFSGNRILSAYQGGNDGSGTAEFDFITDHPTWGGDAAVGTITGFEIFSNDTSNFAGKTLVITKIWFE